MNERKRVTTYLAGAIEHASDKEMKSWRQEMTEKLTCPDLLIYDPVAQESQKVGKPSGQQVEYVKGLKQAGRWSSFYREMWKIWFGNISENTDIIPLLTSLRMKKHIDGNHQSEIIYWGDAEAVVRSDFIVAYMPKDIKTVGTIFEIVWAFMYGIPIYLILPDAPKIDTNSSLIFGIMVSGGEIFYNVNECVRFIKEKHKLGEPEKKDKDASVDSRSAREVRGS